MSGTVDQDRTIGLLFSIPSKFLFRKHIEWGTQPSLCILTVYVDINSLSRLDILCMYIVNTCGAHIKRSILALHDS